MTFPLIVEAFDLEDVFFFLFRNDISTYSNIVIVATMLLFSIVIKTFLVVLIFLFGLVLMGGLLSTKHVRNKRVSSLVFFRVFILLFCWSVLWKTLGIDLSNT